MRDVGRLLEVEAQRRERWTFSEVRIIASNSESFVTDKQRAPNGTATDTEYSRKRRQKRRMANL